MKACKDCRYFELAGTDKENQRFECRRYAPRRTHGVGTGSDEKLWPEVDPLRDWCGQFERVLED